MNKLFSILVVGVILLTLLTSCSSEEPSTPPTDTPIADVPAPTQPAPTTTPMDAIVDLTWQWSELIENQPASQSVVVSPQNYTIAFFTDRKLAAKADCNQVSGVYSGGDGFIALALNASTLAECGAESLSNRYLQLLSGVSAYELREDRLILRGDQAQLIFSKAGPAQPATTEQPTQPAGTPTPNPSAATVTLAVNVRSGPGTQYASYGIAPAGTPVEILGASPDNQWRQVKIDPAVIKEGQGWVNAAYIEAGSAAALPTVQVPVDQIRVQFAEPSSSSAATITILNTVNVRSGPGTNYISYGMAEQGMTGEIVGISKDGLWYQVPLVPGTAPRDLGWVYFEFALATNVAQVPVVDNPPLP